MNLREQKLIWRIGKMRANLALAQARQERDHKTADNCQCPACLVRRALTGGSVPGVTVLRVTADTEAPPAAPSADIKH